MPISDPRLLTTTDWIDIPYKVAKEESGARLDVFLQRRLKGRSRQTIQTLIDSGAVSLSRRPAKPARKLRADETVLVRFPRRLDPPARFRSLDILHEDGHILAVCKPGGLLTHPTDKVRQNSATEILRGQFPSTPLYLAHRLDRETSGVLVFSKTLEASRNLTDQFTRRLASKEYLALVSGEPNWTEKRVDAPLASEGGEIKIRQIVGSGGTSALTEFIVLASNPERSLILARPRTGRLHQIRAHLAWLGHPILGDKLYRDHGKVYLKAVRGETSSEDLAGLGADRQLLHAWRLCLKHPATGKLLRLEAPPPPDFSSRLDPDFSEALLRI